MTEEEVASTESLGGTTCQLAMADPLHIAHPPHRFNDHDGRRHAFPHAIVISNWTKKRVYQLDTSRFTDLSFKFDRMPDDLVGQMSVGVRLILEIKVDESSWREATAGDFPCRKCDVAMALDPRLKKSLFAAKGERYQDMVAERWMALDGSVTWNDIKLNVLSSQTFPQHRQLRFKVEGTGEYANRSELVAYTVPFDSVARTISSKQAAKERDKPSGPTANGKTTPKTPKSWRP